ncbi:hypothetical protein PIB30_035660 [Stylosanthes scabra]|uniref:Uncharacterized protein n=1 Tax=Stylosanthes scabra TaxID=79078 RepID=A0ABU6SD07_9FABA|nr:hypothetical protein [Stylosanthes scabra]
MSRLRHGGHRDAVTHSASDAIRESNAATDRHTSGNGGVTSGDHRVTLVDFMKLRPSQFSESTDPSKVDNWFEEMERSLRAQQVPKVQKVEFVAHLL